MTGPDTPGVPGNGVRPGRCPWTPWDPGPQPADGPGPVRVYCLPHAGGPAGSYLPWAHARPRSGLAFVPVELPGRGTRLMEQPLTSMDAVVDGLLAVLAGRPDGEPFVLFGHSMGAQIAYATAHRLAGTGRPLPRALVVSGSRPPGAPIASRLHDLPDDLLLQGITELGGTPADVLEHQEVMRMILPALRADLTLLADYAARVRPTVLPCPVVALGGAGDRLAGPEWIGGWRSTTAAAFRHRVLPGDHFFVHPNRSEVIDEIAAAAHGARTAPGS